MSIKHPRPEFAPELDWGDPIPLIWQAIRPKVWRLWVPRQFVTRNPAGRVAWLLGRTGSYNPDAEITAVPPGTMSSTEHGWDAPEIAWGNPLPCLWSRYADGRSSMQLGTLRIRLSHAEFHFWKFAEQGFFYPSWTGTRKPSGSIETQAVYYGGPLGSEDLARDWARPTADRCWSLGTLLIEPAGATFVDSPGLLPLKLPNDAEIEVEEKARLSETERERGDILYLRMLRDLAHSEELMVAVGDDRFSAQVQRFLSDHNLTRQSTGANVVITSDRNFGRILSVLRRYGEHYTMYNQNWAEADPEIQKLICSMFERAGYVVA